MMIDMSGYKSYLGNFTWHGLECSGIIHEYPCGVYGTDEIITRYCYFITEVELATALKCSPARLHNAYCRNVDRTYKALPVETIIDLSHICSEGDGEFIYQGKFYRSTFCYRYIFKDLALRRPYLKSAREVYMKLKPATDTHFGRQVVFKA